MKTRKNRSSADPPLAKSDHTHDLQSSFSLTCGILDGCVALDDATFFRLLKEHPTLWRQPPFLKHVEQWREHLSSELSRTARARLRLNLQRFCRFIVPPQPGNPSILPKEAVVVYYRMLMDELTLVKAAVKNLKRQNRNLDTTGLLRALKRSHRTDGLDLCVQFGFVKPLAKWEEEDLTNVTDQGQPRDYIISRLAEFFAHSESSIKAVKKGSRRQVSYKVALFQIVTK